MAEHYTTSTVYGRDPNPLVNVVFHRVSWGAVLAGVSVTLVVQVLLNLLGAGIGAGIVDPASAQNPSVTAASVSTGAWLIGSGVIAAFAGGYVASRLSGRPIRSTGGLHGVITWATTTLVIVYLLTTSIGGLIGGAFAGLGSVLQGSGAAVATAATAAAPSLAKATDPMASIEQSIRNAIGGNDPAALRDAAVASVKAALTGDQAKADEARSRAADALAKAENIPVDQARQQVAQYEQQYKDAAEQAKKSATEAAQTAAKAFSAGAIIAFAALLIGAIASWVGGLAGTTRVTREELDLVR